MSDLERARRFLENIDARGAMLVGEVIPCHVPVAKLAQLISSTRSTAQREIMTKIMIGGNHIASHRADNWPDYDKAEPIDALEIIGAGASYDMWCCWREIMLARDSLKKSR